MLFDPAGDAYQVSIEVALAIAGTTALFFALVVGKLVQVRRKPVEVGLHSMVGTLGEVRRDGYVFANGELWRARAARGEDLRPGERVTVEDVDERLVLTVRPAEAPAPDREPVP
jgi:membrane-bound ClpP family serine protease